MTELYQTDQQIEHGPVSINGESTNNKVGESTAIPAKTVKSGKSLEID